MIKIKIAEPRIIFLITSKANLTFLWKISVIFAILSLMFVSQKCDAAETLIFFVFIFLRFLFDFIWFARKIHFDVIHTFISRKSDYHMSKWKYNEDKECQQINEKKKSARERHTAKNEEKVCVFFLKIVNAQNFQRMF